MKNDWKIKNRYFNAVLYPDDNNYENYMKYIINNFKEVTWIDHDRDLTEDENGEETPKKKHTHILFKVGENARSVKSVAKDIGILPNYLQGAKKIPFLRYLIHLDNPEKTQYLVEEVQGELKEELAKQVKKNYDDEIKISQITTAILNGEIKSTTDLMIYSINNHVTEQTRKYYFLLSKMIGEKQNECKRIRTEREARTRTNFNKVENPK